MAGDGGERSGTAQGTLEIRLVPLATGHRFEAGGGSVTLDPRRRQASGQTPWGEIAILPTRHQNQSGYRVRGENGPVGAVFTEVTGTVNFYVARDAHQHPKFVLRPHDDSMMPGEMTGSDHRYCGYHALDLAGRRVGGVDRALCHVSLDDGRTQRAIAHRLRVGSRDLESIDPRLWAAAILILANDTGDPREDAGHLAVLT